MHGYRRKINNTNATQQLHLKYTFIVTSAPLPAWVTHNLIYQSSCRQCKCHGSQSGACHRALTFRLTARADIGKFSWKRSETFVCKVWLLQLHHQSHTHWIKTSHFQLSKEDSADSSECTVAVKKTYNFRASYQDQMSPSRDLQKFSSRHLKKHLQLREGMKIITTPLLLMSTAASLNLHALSARASPTILSELVFFCCL